LKLLEMILFIPSIIFLQVGKLNGFGKKFLRHPDNYILANPTETKHDLIIKIIAQMETNLRDESIKPN
jgi:hypothetical protein